MTIDIPGWVIGLAVMLPATWLMWRYAKRAHDKQWVRWFGHRWPILPATFLLSGLMPVQDVRWLTPAIVVGLVGVAWFFAGDVHDSHICDECIATWPANASERAEKQRGWLWMQHNLWKILLPLFGILLAASPLHLPALFGSATLATMWMLSLKSRRLHDALKPWCPYCDRGDDGDDDTEDVPTPDDDNSRPVPSGSNR